MFNKVRRIFSHVAMHICSRISRISSERGSVLMFHNIGNDLGELNIDIDLFEYILKSTNGMKIALNNWWLAKERFVALTFDDVKDSFYTNAYPLLKKYDYPFTLFVNVSLLDKPGFITTDNLKELAADPLCTIGSHGMQHRFFYTYSKKEALDDMMNSREVLQELTGQSVELFAFPYGSFAAVGYKKHRLVKKAYTYGFSTINAPISKYNILPLGFLPRINIDNNTIKNFVK